jgi:hypothetical protein
MYVYYEPLLSRLGGVIVSVLAIGPKVCRFKPAWGDCILRAIKIRAMPLARCNKILRHVKNLFEVWTKIFQKQNSYFPRQVPPDLLLDISARRIARELLWTSQFSRVDIIPPWFSC